VIPNLIDAIRHRRPCAEYDDRSAEDFTHVDDAVSATLAAARAPRAAGRALNIGTGRMVSIAEVASLLAETLGTTMVAGLPRKTEPSLRQMCAQTTLAAELLDFVPRVSLAAGLASVVQFATGAEDLEDVLSPVGPEN
jgi:dTDP-L-rhamnose 4-epimerase